MTQVRAKLCGLTKPSDIDAAIANDAAYVGFVFFAKSPRCVDVKTATALAVMVPPGMAKVGLVVNMTDAELQHVTDNVPLDILQLHGSETPERVSEIRAKFGLPVMKAVGIATADDVARARQYAGVADQLLLDAKPTPEDDLPGGNGLSFDWRLLQGQSWYVPWMLAGGLDATNVAEALRLTGANQVDVSSGIEAAPGVKDPEKIADFMTAVKAAG